MSYRVVEYQKGKKNKILLTNSKIFKKAEWQMAFEENSQGTKIEMNVYLKFKPLYFFLILILYFNKQALFRDLDYLKIALNKYKKTNC